MKKYNQITNRKRMTADEAINIIDEMYQNRMKQIEEGGTIYVDKIDDIKFTNLEFAGVILLREVQSLRRKLENSILKEKIEDEIKRLKEVQKEFPSNAGIRVQIITLKELLKED